MRYIIILDVEPFEERDDPDPTEEVKGWLQAHMDNICKYLVKDDVVISASADTYKAEYLTGSRVRE